MKHVPKASPNTPAENLWAIATLAQQNWQIEKQLLVHASIIKRLEFVAKMQQYQAVFSHSELIEQRIITNNGEYTIMGTSLALQLYKEGFTVTKQKQGKDKYELVVSFAREN